MLDARMVSTQWIHTRCLHGISATDAGRSSLLQIMHSSSPSSSFRCWDARWAALPLPHTDAVWADAMIY